jgi:hypothetical protein
VNSRLSAFYQRVLNVLRVPAVRRGQWQLLECLPAWEGNWTSDCFVASAWDDTDRQRLLTTVNYAANQSQCYLRLPWSDLHAHQWRLRDLLGSAVYDRDGQALESTGLYLDMPPWGYHVFSLDRLG